MGSPLRDSILQMVVEDAISPAQKREHLTIKKKYSIVLACKWSGQGIDAYVPASGRATRALVVTGGEKPKTLLPCTPPTHQAQRK